MNKPLVVLRPEPGQTATLVAAFERGMKAVGMPLCEVSPVDWKAPPETYDGVLLGSANAIRHAGVELEKIAHLPVYCVGEATARLARAAGMTVELAGTGGLQAVVDQLPAEQCRLLRLAGQIHLPLQIPGPLTIDTCVTYRTHYRPLAAKQVALLSDGACVLLHSGEMAEHFATQCDENTLDRTMFDIAAMAPRIAERAGEGWNAVVTAHKPNDPSLLAAVQALCDKSP